MGKKLEGPAIAVITAIFILFILLSVTVAVELQNGEENACGTVAQEKISCWTDNLPQNINLHCSAGHHIMTDEISYFVSENSCPKTFREEQPNSFHCKLRDLSSEIKNICDNKQICTRYIPKEETDARCTAQVGVHYLRMKYYCVPNVHLVSSSNVKEISMCDQLEWSGYYANVMSHTGASTDTTFTEDVQCYCRITKYIGTELMIRSLSFSSEKEDSSCTKYVLAEQENRVAIAKLCHSNQLYWTIGCDEETHIDLTYLTHHRNGGVRFQIAVQVAGNKTFSIKCGIPSLTPTPPTTITTSPGGGATDTQKKATSSSLFGLPLLPGIFIIVGIALVLIIIVIVAIILARRSRSKPSSSDSYRDLVEEPQTPPAIPPRHSAPVTNGVPVKHEGMREDAITAFNNGIYHTASSKTPADDSKSVYSAGATYGRLGRFNNLPEVSEVRMSDIEKQQVL